MKHYEELYEFLQEQRQIDEYIAIMQDAVRAMEASQGRCDNSPPNSPTHNNPSSTKINRALMDPNGHAFWSNPSYTFWRGGKHDNCVEAMRLMVEGHFFPMQQHLHSQSGSSRSCDVLELACRVVVQIAKVRGGKAQFLRVRY